MRKAVLLVAIVILALAAAVPALAGHGFHVTAHGSPLIKATVTGDTLTVTTKGLATNTRYDTSCSYTASNGQGINLGATGPISNHAGKAAFTTSITLLEHGLPHPGSATCWLRTKGSQFDAAPVALNDGGHATITGKLT